MAADCLLWVGVKLNGDWAGIKIDEIGFQQQSILPLVL